MTKLAAILARHDADEYADAIAAAEEVSPGYVYGVLREHRPDRTRKPRTRKSEKRRMILGLAAQGIKSPRIAFLCRCTPAYVYKILSE
jgi:hypothetical protein